MKKKKNSRNGNKRVLYKLVQWLEDLINIELTDTEAIDTTYFDDASDDSSDTESESQGSKPFKEAYTTINFEQEFVLDEDFELDK